MNTEPPSHATLIRRMLALGWKYRLGCLQLLSMQGLLLLLTVAGLTFAGVAIDVVRHAVEPASLPPPLPWGWSLPAGADPWRVVWALSAGVALVALARMALGYCHTVAVSKLVQQRIVVELRSAVYDKMQRLSFRFFDSQATGSLINRVTGDVQAVRMFIDGVLIPTILLLMSLAFYLSYMLSIHVGLTLACLATLPGVWSLSAAFSRRVRPAYQRNRELVDDMVLRLAENIGGAQVVKGFGREPEEIARFRQANDAVRDQQRWIFQRVSLYTPVVEFLSNLNLAVLLLYGGWLVMHNHLSIGAGLLVFAGMLQQFSSQVGRIAGIVNSVQRSLAGARRVFEVLDMPLDISSPPNAARPEPMRGHIRFEQVGFAYRPAVPVLNDISLEVRPGECVALVGACGAGKSSLLSLVPRFHDPASGRVLIDGIDARQFDLDWLRRHVGMVFQESFLFSDTVANNIAWGHPEASREQVVRAAEIAAADAFIRALPQGYDTPLREGGANLSGGQRQRLAIARALLLEPPILILDDPTAAIDPDTEDEILHAVHQAIAGRTTLIIAHRVSTLRRADRIVVLERGRILETGTHDELMARMGFYWRASQLQVYDDTAAPTVRRDLPQGPRTGRRPALLHESELARDRRGES